jgi:hypothetical protein
MTDEEIAKSKRVRARLRPSDNKPPPIGSETNLEDFRESKPKDRSIRIDVLTEMGRRLLKTNPNMTLPALHRILVRTAMDWWETTERTAVDYAGRASRRLDNVSKTSSDNLSSPQ